LNQEAIKLLKVKENEIDLNGHWEAE